MGNMMDNLMQSESRAMQCGWRVMERCDRCYSGYMVKWEAPEDHEFMCEFLYICNRCGHAVVLDMGHSDEEGQMAMGVFS